MSQWVLLCPTISNPGTMRYPRNRSTQFKQQQTKPKQKTTNVFEEQKTQTAWVPFNNIQGAIFSVPACYSQRSSKYLERRRRDETGLEQWDFGCVMAFVHLAPPVLCIVCCVVSTSPVGLPLVLSPGGPSLPPWRPSCICLSLTHLVCHTNVKNTHKFARARTFLFFHMQMSKRGFYCFSFWKVLIFFIFLYKSC